MQIHPTLEVKTTAQNLGSSILLICRGTEENLELMLNSLFNFGAISPVRNQLKEIVPIEIEYEDGCHQIATFWTTQVKLKEYFKNLFWIRTADEDFKQFKQIPKPLRKNKKVINTWWENGNKWANEQIEKLLSEHSETFINYAQRRKDEKNDTYSCGKVTAEKPDNSFKDEVLHYAFKPQESV